MADNVRMGAGGVPYKAKSEPKEEVISEVLTVNPNKAKEEKKITESIIEYLANKKAIEKKKIVTENFLKENFSQKKVLLDFKKSINNI